MKIDLSKINIVKAHADMKAGAYTAVDLAEAYLAEATKRNPEINAYLEIYGDVIEQAKAADERYKAGTATAITGIPFAIKDNILIEGRIASAGSKMLEGYKATYDATVIAKLREQGVVFIGRTNMDEFAMGGSTENSAYGPTKNPSDPTRVAGGSSGGSAAALNMSGALAALGSDTGGSIRQPASFNGLVGLKPTYGAVSRYGVMAMGSSLDQIGPFSWTVTDAEIIYDAIKGKDIHDSTTIDGTTYSPQRVGTQKPVIGVPRDFLKGDGIDPAVLTAFNAALDTFKSKGYEIRDVSLPNISYSLMVYYVLMPAEVSSNMARYDGVKYGLHADGADIIGDYFESRRAGFGKEVIRRILLGTYVLSSGYYDAYYNRANAVRAMITDDFLKAFESVDLILTPTAPSPAFKIGEKTSDPVAMYLEDIFTVTANLTGLPAISIPANREHAGALPIGLQMTARHGDEKTLFQAGKEFLGEI